MSRSSIIPSEAFEISLRDEGYERVVGIDEVGRGAWAGPLVVGAVILPIGRRVLGLRDSKALSREERDVLARRLKRIAVSWAIGVIDVRELDEIGLSQSLSVAANRAIAGLSSRPSIGLLDGKHQFKGLDLEHRTIIKGDNFVRCIAAASVIAKVERDRMMRTLHRTESAMRVYRFDLNKGYPSPVHQSKLRQFGPSTHHRTSFAPIRELLSRKVAYEH